jgi:hypothetical protein
MSNGERYKLGDVLDNDCYQMPAFLFEKEFEDLSSDSRMLYMLLSDRRGLSLKNHWVNDNGEIYLIFPREEMRSMLRLSEPTIIKVMNELKRHNLIEEERLGQGKPNRIYLSYISETQISEKPPERPINL